MATIRFHLRKKQDRKNGECPIYLVYTNGCDEVYFTTGRKVLPQYWEGKAVDRWINSGYGEGRHDFNRLLKKMRSDLQGKVNEYYERYEADPTCAQLKKMMETKELKTFFALFEAFKVYQSKSRGVNNVSMDTVDNYKKLEKRLKQYGEYRNITFDFQHIDIWFYDSFVNYCTEVHRNEGNTIGSYIKILLTFLNWAETYHDITIPKPVRKTLKVIDEENSYITLRVEEIDALMDFDIQLNQPVLRTALLWERVRDAWCLQASLGCRVGQLPYAIAENISFDGEKYFWKTKTKKNERHITVPLAERAKRILEKYKGQTPAEWIPRDSIINKEIKLIAKEAGFTERIQVVKGRGVNRREIIFYKWQLIKTHTARYSFINIMLSQGVPDYVVATMTGQSLKTIQRYKHADTRDIERAMQLIDSPRKHSPEPKSPSGEARE